MSIVEAHQPAALGVMQGEGIAQAVRPLGGCCAALDLEFEPVSLFEMVNAAIKRQQELKGVFVGNGRLV
nr:hypothetical protein [uncultured Rhodopila sp.]